MKTITTTIYNFSELNDKAKQVARDWYRECTAWDEWWDGIYEDAKNVGLVITSFDLDRNRHAEGKFVSGAVKCCGNILANHGPDCETYKTATAFLKERSLIPTGDDAEYEKLDDCDDNFLKSILEDYSLLLQREYEYQYSDEAVDETILANEYTFTADGKRAG